MTECDYPAFHATRSSRRWPAGRFTSETITASPATRQKISIMKGLTRELDSHESSCGPDLILTVSENSLVCLIVFLCSLLELDAVDLDAMQLRREVVVENEIIIIVHVPAPGLFL